MRNLLIILILIFPSLMLSQSATKWQQKNADKISSYVIEKMDLNTKDAAFFSKAQLAQIVENANNIKGIKFKILKTVAAGDNPKINKINIIGNNQYFFLININLKNSFKKDI